MSGEVKQKSDLHNDCGNELYEKTKNIPLSTIRRKYGVEEYEIKKCSGHDHWKQKVQVKTR